MGAQTSDARIVGRAGFEFLLDGSDLLGERSQQRERMLALHGESAGKWESCELLLAGGGEKFWTEAQTVRERDSLKAVAKHSADAYQPVTVAQQREDFAAGGRRNVNRGKILVTEQIAQELGVAAIVFLAAASELANGQSVADEQAMAGLLDEAMKPQRVAGTFHTDDCGNSKPGIKRTHIVPLVVEGELMFLTVGFIHPAKRLCADMQIHSDVHCHLRLLSKPKPNDYG
jgi:hypothetical protein